jgi:dTDP-4-dehydrorhamnose reductase
MTTVLVIGANGMLGREVARAAADAGADVVRTGREPRPGWVRFDALRDEPSSLFGAPVDLVVNCAGMLASEIDETNVEAAEAVNRRFPHALADAAEQAGARLVHISTDAVFADDAGLCLEDAERFATDVYGSTKRLGEPNSAVALSLRCSFVGLDQTRRRGLLEWLLAQPDGAEVAGFVDQLWNGLVATQVAAVCGALADDSLFRTARDEGPVHHLFEDPPLTKRDLLADCASAFARDVAILATESGRPVDRVLGSRYGVLRRYLGSMPSRATSLVRLAERSEDRDG